jgi:NAD(P)-dependent dehydrogenase (short-subunit alcohol dehydrogenase family)
MGILEGKLVLVTGAGTGIGQGVAVECARQGADVAIHYAHSAAGARTTAESVEALGRRAVVVPGNLALVTEDRRVIDESARALGGMDILVNNSGVTLTKPFLETTEDDYDEILHINLRAQYFCAQQAVKHMRERGGGAILNITSVHGAASFRGHSAYAASKGGIGGMTRELAVELAPLRIRVNAIGPGATEVPRFRETPGFDLDLVGSWVPWGRMGTPEDMGRVAAFVVSDAAEYVTGQTVYVEGGLLARLSLAPVPLPGQPTDTQRRSQEK